ncbi:hypothetical protein [Azotobacter armeniacus]
MDTTVPAKAWTGTLSARALATTPAKCLRIIKDFPFSSNFEKHTSVWRIAGMGRNLGKALLQTDFMEKNIQQHWNFFRKVL